MIPPARPSNTENRLTTTAVLAIRSSSPVPTDTAICLTPLRSTPRPAMLAASSPIDMYTDIRPKPAGPRRTARIFVLTIPTRSINTCEPPISADDFRIWPCKEPSELLVGSEFMQNGDAEHGHSMDRV